MNFRSVANFEPDVRSFSANIVAQDFDARIVALKAEVAALASEKHQRFTVSQPPTSTVSCLKSSAAVTSQRVPEVMTGPDKSISTSSIPGYALPCQLNFGAKPVIKRTTPQQQLNPTKLHPDSAVDSPTASPLPSAVEVVQYVFPRTLAARIPVTVKDLAAVVPEMQLQLLGIKHKQAEAIMYRQ